MQELFFGGWRAVLIIVIILLPAQGAIISKIQQPTSFHLELNPNDSIALEKVYHATNPSGSDPQLLAVQLVCSQKKKNTVNYSCDVVKVASPQQE